MRQRIEQLKKEFDTELQNTSSSIDLENVKIKFLGKKGPVQDLMKSLKDVTTEERPASGKIINELKEHITEAISQAELLLIAKEDIDRLQHEKLDVTLPGRKNYIGRKHIINQVLDEILDILIGMGFSVQLGPDIDTDYYNFEALNFAADHPARDMQDTFYIASNILLRTHTSNVQVRVMEANQPPLRIIAPGKVYRNETITARSHVFFQQVEAIYIDRNVSFADLQVTMREFLSKLFHADVEVRFRSSYFPFVEPGMEVDLRCLNCQGAGCGLCKHTGWLEVAGAGMVHPTVLKNAGIDPEDYSGFAWGMGVERLVLLKHGVKDIRMFTENDVRFLGQFSGI